MPKIHVNKKATSLMAFAANNPAIPSVIHK